MSAMTNDKVIALKRTALFKELEDKTLSLLAEHAVPRHYRKDEVLFLAGEEAHGLFRHRERFRAGLPRKRGARTSNSRRTCGRNRRGSSGVRWWHISFDSCCGEDTYTLFIDKLKECPIVQMFGIDFPA